MTGWLEPELELEPEPEEPCDPLVRVLTGALECVLAPEEPEPEPELDEPELCEPLVRVATGEPDETPEVEAAAELWPPLARVATPAALDAEPLPEWPCEPLAPVLTEPPWDPRPPVAIAPRGVGKRPERSWRTTWTVRLITCVRYCTAGVRAASVATVLSAGCIA